MKFYELLQAFFGRSEPRRLAAPQLFSASANGFSALAHPSPDPNELPNSYLPEDKIAFLLRQHYGEDFHALLYRPATANFIRNEVMLLPEVGMQSWRCLDGSHWSHKHPLNFPGPFYTGQSDTCGTGPEAAAANVLLDDEGAEYIFRQPQDFSELLGVLDAAARDPFESYACDGNEHWTYQLCREWWRTKADILFLLNSTDFRETNGNDVQRYLDYLTDAAETDLRKYCYFLENGVYPSADVVNLPTL